MAKADNSEGNILRNEINGNPHFMDIASDDIKSHRARLSNRMSGNSVSSSSSPKSLSKSQQSNSHIDDSSASLSTLCLVDQLTSSEISVTVNNESASATSLARQETLSKLTSTLVAGPHQRQPQHQNQKGEPLENVLPNVAAEHRIIRNLMGGYGSGTLQQQQLLRTIKSYIGCCRNEYEDILTSPLKCRRLARTVSQTMNWFHHIITTFEDFKFHFTTEYVHCMIELVAIYVSSELRYAKELKDHKPSIANRIMQNVYKHLRGSRDDETVSNILRMFTHIPNMYRQHEVMTKIFEKLIPKEQVILQKELPDAPYIQYLIAFYHWKQLEPVEEQKMRVIDFANKFMRPAKTLCTNATYAYHLPKYTSLTTATRYILINLKFFHDLRNASIYDNRLKTNMGIIDVSDEDEPIFSKASVVINFAELVQSSQIPPATRPMVKLEDKTVIATIDLTEENNGRDTELEWLEEFQRNARKLEPPRGALEMFVGRRASISENEIIEINSDNDEETENSALLSDKITTSLEEMNQLYLKDGESSLNTNCNKLIDRLSSEDNSCSNRNSNARSIASATGKTSPSLVKLNVDSSAISLPPQSKFDANQSKLNIISVCSIAPNQIDKTTLSTRRECPTSTNFVAPLPSTRNVSVKNIKSYSTSKTQTDIGNSANVSSFTPSELDARDSNVSITATASIANDIDFSDCGDRFALQPISTDVRSIASTQTTEKYDCSLPNSTSGEQFLADKTKANSSADGMCGGSIKTNCSDVELTQINPQIFKITAASKQDRNRISASSSTFGDDEYLCRRNSLHINSSPINNENKNKKYPAQHCEMIVYSNPLSKREQNATGIDIKTKLEDENDGDDDDEESDEDDGIMFPVSKTCKNISSKKTNIDAFKGSKVIYSVNNIAAHQDVKDLPSEDEVVNKDEDHVKTNSKKLVKFSNDLVEHKRNQPLQYPIKSALKSSNTVYTSPALFQTRVNSESPVSTSSSTCAKSTNLKGPYRTIPDEFSRYYSTQEDGTSRSITTGLPRQTLPNFLKKCVYKPRLQLDDVRPVDMGLTINSDMQGTDKTSLLKKEARLQKECYIRLEYNKELNQRLVAFMNELLQKQREARKKVLERKKHEEYQRILNEKLLEEKKLKEEIMELKRQQAEKDKMRAYKQLQIEQKKRERRNRTQKKCKKISKNQNEIINQGTLCIENAELNIQDTNSVDSREPAQNTTDNIKRCSRTNPEKPNKDSNPPVSLNILQNAEDESQDHRATESNGNIYTSTPISLSSKGDDESIRATDAMIKIVEPPKNSICPQDEKREIVCTSACKTKDVMEIIKSPNIGIKHVKIRLKRTLWECSNIQSDQKDVNENGDEAPNKINRNITTDEAIDENEKRNIDSHLIENIDTQLKLLLDSNIPEDIPNIEESSNAVSSLAMLANTAANAETLPQPQLTNNESNTLTVTKAPSPLAPSQYTADAAEAKAQSHLQAEGEKEIADKTGDYNDGNYSNSYMFITQNEPFNCRFSYSPVPVAATASFIENTKSLPKQSNLTLVSLEATPTVPPYLFNGESRDINTPTPPNSQSAYVGPTTEASKGWGFDDVVADKVKSTTGNSANKVELAPPIESTPLESKPVKPNPMESIPLGSTPAESAPVGSTPVESTPVGSTFTPLERAQDATATTDRSSSVSFTSDHEVSSTQETPIRGTMKPPRLNDIPKSKTLSKALSSISPSLLTHPTTTAVQNNQIDTTHHLPESTTKGVNGNGSSRALRRRSRKLSTYDENLIEGAAKNKLRACPLEKRRKTVCTGSPFHEAEKEERKSSSLINGKQHTGISRSTTTKADNTMAIRVSGRRGRLPKKPVTESTVFAKKATQIQTTPTVSIADNPNNKRRANFDSRGVSNLTHNTIKQTASRNNFKSISVPPELEKRLDREQPQDNRSMFSRADGKIAPNSIAVRDSVENPTNTDKRNENINGKMRRENKRDIVKTAKGAKMKIDTKNSIRKAPAKSKRTP